MGAAFLQLRQPALKIPTRLRAEHRWKRANINLSPQRLAIARKDLFRASGERVSLITQLNESYEFHPRGGATWPDATIAETATAAATSSDDASLFILQRFGLIATQVERSSRLTGLAEPEEGSSGQH
jgi:hypothetical protein